MSELQAEKPGSPPAFLITIDTEGDNIWSSPRTPETRNAVFLPRFQSLCERHSLKPTYLTNWEMAGDPQFQELATEALRVGTAEVGMHLHAWHQPPEAPLTDADWRFKPFLIEYPADVLREKVRRMTDRLESIFQTKMVSHRAGRWAFDGTYAQALIEEGYRVDCSVTPHVSWAIYKGDPEGRGGSDYRAFPETEYFLSPQDIGRAGRSPLLELPVTVMRRRWSGLVERTRDALAPRRTFPARALERWRPSIVWLRPNGRNLRDLLWVLQEAERQRRPYVEFILHSSEFMPGGSPVFASEAQIERLYEHLEVLFAATAGRFTGMTLQEYAAGRAAA